MYLRLNEKRNRRKIEGEGGGSYERKGINTLTIKAEINLLKYVDKFDNFDVFCTDFGIKENSEIFKDFASKIRS